MIFSEELLSEIKDNPADGTITLIHLTRNALIKDPNEWHPEDHDVFMQAFALITEIVEADLLEVDLPDIEITGNISEDCSTISNYLSYLEELCSRESSNLKMASLRSHFKAALGSGFHYEFSQGDLERLQVLINQIRDEISASKELEKDHQRRLLIRLEKLQSELHKKVSDLDRFWGLIGDAGVVLGKVGKDAKPIVDRIREVAEIVWQTQSRAEELPSGTQFPLLQKKDIQ